MPDTRGGSLDHGTEELDQLVDNSLLAAVFVPQVLHLLPQLAVLVPHVLQLLVQVLLSVLDVADLGEHLGHLLSVDRHDLVEAPGRERDFPLDLLQQMLLAAFKVGVGELHLLPLGLQAAHLDVHDLVEVVHVQLADEGGHVGVFVVVRQQGLGELGLILYNEGFPFDRPTNQMIWGEQIASCHCRNVITLFSYLFQDCSPSSTAWRGRLECCLTSLEGESFPSQELSSP